MKAKPIKPFKPCNLPTYPIRVLKDKKQDILNQYERLLKMRMSEKPGREVQAKYAIEFNKGLDKDKRKMKQILEQLTQSIDMLEAINNNKF
jgi:hypothetical protein